MIHFNTVACVRAKSLQSCSTLCDPVAHQGPLSMVSSRQEYWSGLSCPPPEDLLDLGKELVSPAAPALQEDSFSFFLLFLKNFRILSLFSSFFKELFIGYSWFTMLS